MQNMVLTRILKSKTIFIDLTAFAAVALTSIIGMLYHLPFYMLEPIRLMVVISIAHSTRNNSFFLASVLPLYSWIVTGHPELLKMIVMTTEICSNVFLYYYLIKRVDSVLMSMIISVIISKVICYALYLIFFSLIFIEEEADTSFLICQVITTLIFSFYVWIILQKNKTYNEKAI